MMAWLHRAGLGGLLLLAYLYAWTPARTAWIEYGAAPLLAQGTEAEVTARPRAHLVHVHTTDGTTFKYQGPAGVKFLLPGLFLLLVAPARPRLGLFFAGHLGIGLLALALMAVGTSGVEWGLDGARFVQTYGVDAYSLMVPVLVFARGRVGTSG